MTQQLSQTEEQSPQLAASFFFKIEFLIYDANGNLLSGFGFNYTYNGFNELTSVRNTGNGNLTAEYFYDADGNRIMKKGYGSNGVNTTTYYVDESFIQISNSSGTFNETYYYDSRDLIAMKSVNGKMFYYHPDHLGSTTLITNSSGDLDENTFYLPFGDVLSGGNERFGYTGKEKDTETNLNYYGARYYDSYFMHFTQADIIIADIYNPQNLNRYSYVLNNPYKYVDESGNEPIEANALLIINSGVRSVMGTYLINNWRENLDTKSVFGLLAGRTYGFALKSQIDISAWAYEESGNLAWQSAPGYTEPSATEMTEIRENAVYGATSIGLSTIGSMGNFAVQSLSHLDLASTILTGEGLAEQIHDIYNYVSGQNKNDHNKEGTARTSQSFSVDRSNREEQYSSENKYLSRIIKTLFSGEGK